MRVEITQEVHGTFVDKLHEEQWGDEVEPGTYEVVEILYTEDGNIYLVQYGEDEVWIDENDEGVIIHGN